MRCAHECWPPACAICHPISVAKDRLWAFNHTFKHKDTVAISSKAQFDRECQSRGLRRVVKDDLLKNGVPYKPEDPKVPTQLVQSTVQKVLKEVTHAKIEANWARQLRQRQAGALAPAVLTS